MNIRLRPFRSFVLLFFLLPGSLTYAASLRLDENFRVPQFSIPFPNVLISLLPDGKFVLYAGNDSLVGQPSGAIARYFSDGSLDSAFQFSRDYKEVSAAAPAKNGKLYVAAVQTVYETQQNQFILRLNEDGSPDSSFQPALVASGAESGSVRRIVVQPDGKVLVGGSFDSFGATGWRKIARLLPSGEPDPSFTPATFPGGGTVWKIALLPDGKILVGGDYGAVNGQSCLGLVRLQADGVHDPAFQASGYTSGSATSPVQVRGIVVQADGRIVIGGRFRIGSGSPVAFAPLFRLNPDGSADASFTLTTYSSTLSRDVVAQPDGRLVSVVAQSLERFHSDGARDLTFRRPQLQDDSSVSDLRRIGAPISLALQPDGKILLAGNFTDVDVPPEQPLTGAHFGVARLNSDGVLDPTLVTSNRTASVTAPGTFSRLADGSTWITFETYRRRLAPALSGNVGRLLTNGQVDSVFNLGPPGAFGFLSPHFLAAGMEPMADGRFFVWGTDAGSMLSYGAVRRDGIRDAWFSSDETVGAFEAADAQADGKLLLSAGTDPQATVDNTLLRLKPNGRRDMSFQVDGAIRSVQVVRDQFYSLDRLAVGARVLALQPDGKTIFEYFSTDGQMHLVRLQPDGSLDNSFTSTSVPGPNLRVNYPIVNDPNRGNVQPANGALTADFPFLGASVQNDGRILIVGQFTSFAGTPARGIVRLNSDGTVDATFSSGGGAQWTETTETASFLPKVEAITILNDGKLLLAGTFEAFDGVAAPGIVSLTANGAVDPAFSPPVSRLKFSRLSTKLERQADGSVLLAGAYRFPNENEPRFLRIENLGGVPIVGGPVLATALIGEAFSYQIVASGQPTSYGATGLPSGFNIHPTTGEISGTATSGKAGVYSVNLTATNAEGSSAPRTLSLTIPPPISPPSAVSRRAHPGAAQFFDIPLPQTGMPGVECRRLANGEFHTLVLSFATELANVGSASVTNGSGQTYGGGISSEDQHIYVVYLRDVPDAQEITVSLDDVTDSFGSHTPNVTVRLAVLAGDVNGSGSVNGADISQTKAFSGQPLTSSNFRADVSVSGAINSSDVSFVRSQSGASLPAGLARARDLGDAFLFASAQSAPDALSP